MTKHYILRILVKHYTWSHHFSERWTLSISGDPSHPVSLDRALGWAPPHRDTVVIHIHHLHVRGRVNA